MSSKHKEKIKKYGRKIKSLESKRDKLIKTIKKNKKTILSNLDNIIESLPEVKSKNDYDMIMSFKMGGAYSMYGMSARYMAAMENPSIINLHRLTLNALSGVKINEKDTELFYKILHNWINFRMPSVEYHHEASSPNKIEYFLYKKEIEKLKEKINEDVEEIIDFYFQKQIDMYNTIILHRLASLSKRKRGKLIQEFLNKNGKYFYRELTPDKNEYKVITFEEMKGKYGWFKADNKYKLEVYYTGYYLSKNKFVEFLKEYMYMNNNDIDYYLESKIYYLSEDFV
ncbi:MAG: hypothetical protein KatS3mg096_633 [Candidatus Parcubacteria bacterium]|nr:MAG: hypothetical protein KatS3mg096_633 [Candidatus Parcubacteria bacterium]